MFSLLKNTKSCQICKKSFANEKALEGHMRSDHNQKLSVQCRKSEPGVESSTSSTIPSLLQTPNKPGANFRPPETVLMRSVHSSEEAVVGPKPDLSKEGEQQITGKRKIFVELDEVNPKEFRCCFLDEETVLCLIDMSKRRPEKCPTKVAVDGLVSTRKRKYTEKYIKVDSVDVTNLDEDEDKKDGDAKSLTSDVGILSEDDDEDSEDTDTDDDDDDDDYYEDDDSEDTDTDCDDDDSTYFVGREQKRTQPSERKCDICGKVFRSYQALGGHRTSHTNKRLKISDKNDQSAKPKNGAVVRRHFTCQICGRVFESGQALGGHRKLHYAFL